MTEKLNLKRIKSAMSSTGWQALIICTLVGLLYGYSVTFGFVLDDKIVITENQFVQKGLSGLSKIFTTEGFEGYFGEQRELVIGARYRPLSLAMFAIEKSLVGDNAWLGHLMNLILYGLLGIMILKWAQLNFPEKKAHWLFSLPFIIALIYVLHPVHVEAVANIKGRDEILSMLLSMGALMMAQKYLKNQSLFQLFTTGVVFFLALLAKENSVAFLFVIPFTLWWISKAGMKPILLVSAVLLAGLAGYLAMRNHAVGYILPKAISIKGDLMNNPFVEMDVSEKWATITYTMGKYLQLLIFPHPLTHDYYPYHIPRSSWNDVGVFATIVLAILIVAASLLSIKRQKWAIWSLLFFLATICLVSNAFFTVGTFMNERFLFMPSLAFAVMLGLGLGKLTKSQRLSKLGWAILIIVLMGYGIKDLLRVPDWKNGYTLNQSAIKVSKNSARINMFVATDYYNQATALTDRNQRKVLLTEAKKHLERSKNIYRLYGSANNMLTGVCAELFKDDNDIKALLSCFKNVATDRPDTEYLNQFLNFLVQNGNYNSELAKFYEDTGYDKLYQERNNFPHALRYLREAEKLNPGSRTLYEKLSSVYLAFGYHLQDYPDPNYKAAEIIESGRYYGNKAVQ